MKSKGAEIARRYRERRDADPERKRKYLERERDKWKKDREAGKKGVNELSEREKRAKRKKWREAKSRARARNRASALLQAETPDNPRRPEMIEVKHIGEWCVVNYDNEAYPGVIRDVEGHSVKVKCMHRYGINKFHWPSLRDDICWYHDWQVLCLIPEPQAVKQALCTD